MRNGNYYASPYIFGYSTSPERKKPIRFLILEIIPKSTSFFVQTEGIFTFLNICGYRMALAEATVSEPTLSEATPVKGAKAVEESRTSDSSEYLVFVFWNPSWYTAISSTPLLLQGYIVSSLILPPCTTKMLLTFTLLVYLFLFCRLFRSSRALTGTPSEGCNSF